MERGRLRALRAERREIAAVKVRQRAGSCRESPLKVAWSRDRKVSFLCGVKRNRNSPAWRENLKVLRKRKVRDVCSLVPVREETPRPLYHLRRQRFVVAIDVIAREGL